MRSLAAASGARIPHVDNTPVTSIVAAGGVNAGTTSAIGVTVSGLSALGVYEVLLPPGQAQTGWSGWPNGTVTPPPSQQWGNRVYLTGGPGAAVGPFDPRSSGFGDVMGYPDGESARAAFPGGFVTGYTEYTLWMYDDAPSDDRGGLSIRLRRVG